MSRWSLCLHALRPGSACSFSSHAHPGQLQACDGGSGSTMAPPPCLRLGGLAGVTDSQDPQWDQGRRPSADCLIAPWPGFFPALPSPPLSSFSWERFHDKILASGEPDPRRREASHVLDGLLGHPAALHTRRVQNRIILPPASFPWCCVNRPSPKPANLTPSLPSTLHNWPITVLLLWVPK